MNISKPDRIADPCKPSVAPGRDGPSTGSRTLRVLLFSVLRRRTPHYRWLPCGNDAPHTLRRGAAYGRPAILLCNLVLVVTAQTKSFIAILCAFEIAETFISSALFMIKSGERVDQRERNKLVGIQSDSSRQFLLIGHRPTPPEYPRDEAGRRNGMSACHFSS
jgi:hypothetical protein